MGACAMLTSVGYAKFLLRKVSYISDRIIILPLFFFFKKNDGGR